MTVLREDQTCIVSFNDRGHFVLDLDNVKIIDSCGVGLIIVANNLAMSRGAKLYLANMKPFIVKILDIMRISKHLTIFETEEMALEAIKVG
ncbi:MAG: STAS domain-containing protein [Planctomycetota bacterium]